MLTRVFVEKDGNSTAHKVVDAFIHGRSWVVFLEGIDTCDKAEGLAGAVLAIPSSERMALPEDSYYLDELIGLDVHTLDGLYLGIIKEVMQTGSNDVYVVRNDSDGGRETLIPALKAVVKRIDMDARRVEIDPPEGLL